MDDQIIITLPKRDVLDEPFLLEWPALTASWRRLFGNKITVGWSDMRHDAKKHRKRDRDIRAAERWNRKRRRR